MAHTLYEAALAAQNPLAAGIFKSIHAHNEMFSFVPFIPKEGEAFSFVRECKLPTVEWVAPGAILSESSGHDQKIVVPKRELSSNFDLDRYVLRNQVSTSANDPLTRAVQRKSKALGMEISRAMVSGKFATSVTFVITGDPFTALSNVVVGPYLDNNRQGVSEVRYTNATNSWEFRAPGDIDFGEPVVVTADTNGVRLSSQNKDRYIVADITVASATADGRSVMEISSTSNEPDGLKNMVSPAQTISPANGTGQDFDFDLLDAALDLVENKGGRVAIICRKEHRRKIRSMLRAMPGNTADHIQAPGFDSDGAPTQVGVHAYEGEYPILRNDFISKAAEQGDPNTDVSDIYIVNFQEDEGFYVGAFGGSNIADAGLSPLSGPVMGVELVSLGDLEQQNRLRWRLNAYMGFALGSDFSASRITNARH